MIFLVMCNNTFPAHFKASRPGSEVTFKPVSEDQNFVQLVKHLGQDPLKSVSQNQPDRSGAPLASRLLCSL